MTSLPSSTSLILVAVITDPRDLEIARLLGWYRIPLRSAPKVVSVDYLAFYQTAAFNEEKWRINYVAPVRGHELTTRVELLHDEPDHIHASREYYKISIGELARLPHPILADKWRRITFFYTTGEYLNAARVINDLIIESGERQLLWQALRERANQDQRYTYRGQEYDDFNLSADILTEILGFRDFGIAYDQPEDFNLSEEEPASNGW